MREIKWKTLLICFVIVYGIAFAGSLFTDANSSWYESVKPAITPPNYVFPIVWNILFFLIALALYYSWTDKKSKKLKSKIATVFGINLSLNFLWGILFFKMQNPIISFFELIILWISIIILISTTSKINRHYSYLLIPYLLWVSFAGILNYLIAFS